MSRDDAEMSIPRLSVGATAVFAVFALAAVIWPGMRGVSVAVDLLLFLVGCAAFAVALVRAAGRSRSEEVSLAALFFLAGGVAPRRAATWLWGAFAGQVVVALVTAGVRPFSELAFGVLAPTFGLSMLAFWASTHGHFPARDPRSVG